MGQPGNSSFSGKDLQTIFYIKPQKVMTAPLKRTQCKVHDDKKLEFYCVKCDEAICLNCKLTKHEQHQTDDLTTAAKQKTQELSTDVARLREAVDKVQKQVERSKQEQQAVMDKKAAVEKNIHNRHAIMVAAADKFRDEALQSLRSVSADIESDVATLLKQQEGNLQELMNIQQRLQQTIQGGTGSDVIVLSKQMRSGSGSQQAVKKLTSTQLSVISRPILNFKVTSDVMLQKARDFLGTVCRMKMDYAPKRKIEKRILCGTEADVEVFALCHVDDDRGGVWVSYERLGLKEDMPQILFNEDGSKRLTSEKKGKISNKRCAKEQTMCPTVKTGRMITFCKSLTTKHFRLDNQLSGKANVDIENVLSIEPFKSEAETAFTITVGAHRSFDVDATEQHFVVVEELKPPNMWRKVRLY